MTPFLQGALALAVQLAPSEQGMHVRAALQTWPAPQLAPGLFGVPFMQPAGSHIVTPLVH